MGGIEDMINDYMNHASHNDHAEHAAKMQQYIEDIRIPILLKHFKDSLDDKAREEFGKKDIGDQIKALQDKEYKLPADYAERFMNDVALHAAKKIDEGIKLIHGKDSHEIAPLLEKPLKVLADPKADAKAKAAAKMQIDHYKLIVQSYGVNLDEMMKTGLNQGFTKQVFDAHVKNFGNTYHSKVQHSFMDQISEDNINKYLKGLADEIKKDEEGKHDLKGFRYDILEKGPAPLKKQFAISYVNAKKDKEKGGIKAFRKDFSEYFK
ncbi:hypothetical protein JW711_04780 [Candidatus Woesearchaeota archaeon]|nr:hypothetical protein [Candidatus Woesearchaeota archaeon]